MPEQFSYWKDGEYVTKKTITRKEILELGFIEGYYCFEANRLYAEWKKKSGTDVFLFEIRGENISRYLRIYFSGDCGPYLEFVSLKNCFSMEGVELFCNPTKERVENLIKVLKGD